MLPSSMTGLPQLGHVLDGWLQTVLLKTVTRTTVDFKPVEVVTVEPLLAVVQPTAKTNLNKDTLDWTKDNFTFHSKAALKIGQLIEYKGRDFKLAQVADYSDYGYWEAVGEDTKQPVRVAT